MRLALTAAASLVLASCAGPEIPSIGLDLGDAFSSRADWFWEYDNDDYGVDRGSRWVSLGDTSPNGEPLHTFRIWNQPLQDILDDVADGSQDTWDVHLYFVQNPDGWYLKGWEANPDGTQPEVGTEYLDGDGVPFAMTNVTQGKSWTASLNEREWTTTANEELENLQFNGYDLRGVWRLDITTDTGDTPIEGSWWLAGGPGIVQYDLEPFASDEDEPAPWQLKNNDTMDNFLGVAR